MHPDRAMTFIGLAALYSGQGKYAEAEPLYKHALAIQEKTLGPTHPDLATSLEHYADLLRKMKRETLAAEMEARAETIRTKRSGTRPGQ